MYVFMYMHIHVHLNTVTMYNCIHTYVPTVHTCTMYMYLYVFQANHEHLFLQGTDRLYLNKIQSVCDTGAGHGKAKDFSSHGGKPQNGIVASPQWRVIQVSTRGWVFPKEL